MNKVRDNRLKKQDTIYIIVFIMIVALQVWKSHIGPGYTDEHFYLAVADRVAKGDAMLYDIWDIGQLMVFFTFPLVKLFRFVTGGTEEIVLASRLVYVLFTMGIGTGIYLKFRKDSHWSVLSAAIFMLYTPFNIMALSYNTLAIGFTILGLLFYPRNHMRAFNLYMCGVFMASAVLNSPYYILMYLFLSVVMVFNRRIVPVRSWFWISAGAFSLAGVFMVFVLSHAPLAGIIANLPNLVDPQHSTNSLVVFAENGGRLILAYRWFMIALVSELILTLVWRNDGAKKQKLIDYSIIINTIAIIYVTVLRPYYPLTGGFTIILIPFAIIGIEGCILHKQDYYIVSCFIASLILAFCISLSTNVGPNSFAAPLIIACSVMAVFNNYSKLSKGFSILLVCMLLFFKTTETFGQSSFVYHEQIQMGPLKGLYATEKEIQIYEERIHDMEDINSMKGDTVRVLTWNCWEYLALGKTLAQGYTIPCFYEGNDYFIAEKTYQDFFSDKYPTLFYVDSDNPFVEDGQDPRIDGELYMDLVAGRVYLLK